MSTINISNSQNVANVGDNQTGNISNQSYTAWPEGLDLTQLISEISSTRKAMKAVAMEQDDAELDTAIGHLAQAEQQAKDNNPSKTLEALKAGGKFVLEFAQKVGAGWLVKMITEGNV